MPNRYPHPNRRDEDLIGSALRAHAAEIDERARSHVQVLNSKEYQNELRFLQKTTSDLLATLRLCEVVASRWDVFRTSYLMPMYIDEIAEAALMSALAIENGAINAARRELRYMLEVAVNVAYVDHTQASAPQEDRIALYRGKGVSKANVDHIHDLPLRLLGAHRGAFAADVKGAWVKASNHVHLTKRRIDEKLKLREKGITLGFETQEMLSCAVADVHAVCSAVMILAFETIGPSFTGDLFVGAIDDQDDWALHASGYIAIVDAYFDDKAERCGRLESHAVRRAARIRFPVASAA